MQTHDDLVAGPSPAVPAPARVEAAPAVARVATQAPDAGLTATPEVMLELQRTAGNASVAGLLARQAARREDDEAATRSPVLDVVGRGGGQPMPTTLRREMEGRLGADFSDVRVHTDSEASQSAEAVNAHAYTVGSDVVFRSDRWNPDSSEGKTTLAHELTHVMQQRDGPVDGTPTGDGIRLSDPSDPYERAAASNAASAMTAPAPATAAAQGDFVQREAAPEDEEEGEAAQGDFVQREAAPEDEEEGEAAQGDFVQREAAPAEDQDQDEEEPPAAQGDFVQREAAPEDDEGAKRTAGGVP